MQNICVRNALNLQYYFSKCLSRPHGSHPSFRPPRRMTVWLSTAPTEPLTHWYQVRCLLQSPLFTKAGDTLSGTALLVANKRYDASKCISLRDTMGR